MSGDARLFAPSAARNREPILAGLRAMLPGQGTVLEVASGTGEHIAHFAAATPHLHWQPTDVAVERRASIDAWTAGMPNVSPALPLNATAADWLVGPVAAVLCINMIHIAPWSAAQGLVAGAARVLPPGGLLALYGPYRRAGVTMQPGNAAFDADLRRRDPAWGLRLLEDLAALATEARFGPPEIQNMPADNLLVSFRLG